MPNERNPVVRFSAILRKGGAHTSSVSGQRHQSKRQLNDEVDEYFNQHCENTRADPTHRGKQVKHKNGTNLYRPFFLTNIFTPDLSFRFILQQ